MAYDVIASRLSIHASLLLRKSSAWPQVLWDVQTGRAICGSPAHNSFTNTVKFFNNRNDKLMTGGHYNLLIREYDMGNTKLRHTDVNMGQLRRIFNTITIDHDDAFAYCGTTTGDILQVGV
jgi:hypothetical protein